MVNIYLAGEVVLISTEVLAMGGLESHESVVELKGPSLTWRLSISFNTHLSQLVC